jgi:hypothetical protein
MENPSIDWIQKSGKSCLKFIFKGNFTEQDAVSAVEKWNDAFEARPDGKIVLIWDCQEMNDYDHDARTLWQNKCKEYKDRIETIWVITDSLLIKMGASVISVFTSMKIKVVGSENDISIG